MVFMIHDSPQKQKRNAVKASRAQNSLATDARVNSRAYVNAVAQIEMDRIKQQALTKIFKREDPPINQIHVINGQLDKLLAVATPKPDIGEHILQNTSSYWRIWQG